LIHYTLLMHHQSAHHIVLQQYGRPSSPVLDSIINLANRQIAMLDPKLLEDLAILEARISEIEGRRQS
jgi:hypothetical protein